jgi:hypothetical protein
LLYFVHRLPWQEGCLCAPLRSSNFKMSFSLFWTSAIHFSGFRHDFNNQFQFTVSKAGRNYQKIHLETNYLHHWFWLCFQGFIIYVLDCYFQNPMLFVLDFFSRFLCNISFILDFAIFVFVQYFALCFEHWEIVLRGIYWFRKQVMLITLTKSKNAGFIFSGDEKMRTFMDLLNEAGTCYQ